MFTANIERIDNGYLVTHVEEQDEDRFVEHKFCFQESEYAEFGEEKCFAEALLYLKEYFGLYYNKHRDINLHIGFTNQKGKGIEWDEVK